MLVLKAQKMQDCGNHGKRVRPGAMWQGPGETDHWGRHILSCSGEYQSFQDCGMAVKGSHRYRQSSPMDMDGKDEEMGLLELFGAGNGSG